MNCDSLSFCWFSREPWDGDVYTIILPHSQLHYSLQKIFPLRENPSKPLVREEAHVTRFPFLMEGLALLILKLNVWAFSNSGMAQKKGGEKCCSLLLSPMSSHKKPHWSRAKRWHNLLGLAVLCSTENTYSNNPKGFGVSLGALLQMSIHNTPLIFKTTSPQDNMFSDCEFLGYHEDAFSVRS